MFPNLPQRFIHLILLLVVSAGLFLPALGTPSLWDIDEGHNAEAAREMLDAGTWITPTFNYQLRVDKPALLYWLQMAAYRLLGVSELAARLPSALAALLTVLLVYELGRRLFDAGTGLLAGVILASALLFCGSAHFANPDALLNACTVLTLLLFWQGFVQGHSRWLVWSGVSTALGFLAKGPVALLLPATVIGLFLLWNRQLRCLWDRNLLLGWLVWGLLALPWFALVGSETKGEFLSGFFLKHNRDRFLTPLEGHNGPIFYHVLSLTLGFLPWTVFLVPTLWLGLRDALGSTAGQRPCPCRLAPSRFLFCWITVYFVFFSISRTKLPNYILPLYPAVALLTANFLENWRRGALRLPGWLMPLTLAGWALVGVGTSLALLVASGAMSVPILRGQRLPGLESVAVFGVLPVLGTLAASWCWRRQYRPGLVACLAGSAVVFTAALAAWGGGALEAHKAPRFLVEQAQACQPFREVRVACYQWYQPSLVFYCGREVQQLLTEAQVLEFLQAPWEVYLFLPADTWHDLKNKASVSCCLLGSRRCFYRNCEVVVVSNRQEQP